MTLVEAKLNTNLIVKNINTDEKTKLRLMELGLLVGNKIIVKKRSSLKRTLLVIFNNACFTINAEIAKDIEVCYG